MNLLAQDYRIYFEGTGATTNVDSVRVENLTQGTEIEMKGSEVLHLMSVTGIEKTTVNEKREITFYPNPVTDYAHMRFFLPAPGEIVITLNDLSGRDIFNKRYRLSAGQHNFGIRNIEQGTYIAMIRSGRYSMTGRLISLGSKNIIPDIEYENGMILNETPDESKGGEKEIIMQYNEGDRLIFTAYTENYKTVIADIPGSASGTITFKFTDCGDANSNNYSVVQIGTQTWMAENLKTTRLNDGTDIPNVTDGNAWKTLSTSAYCWFNNDITNKEIYGALYNWHTVATGKLCPAGWHVPLDSEWEALIYYLYTNGYKCDGSYGGTYAVAKSLAATTHWKLSSAAGAVGNKDFPDKRNATGFTALPGSSRYSDPGGEFGGVDGTIGDYANWWSATEVSGTTSAKGRWMSYSNYGLWSYNFKKTHGFSVRCIKD